MNVKSQIDKLLKYKPIVNKITTDIFFYKEINLKKYLQKLEYLLELSKMFNLLMSNMVENYLTTIGKRVPNKNAENR